MNQNQQPKDTYKTTRKTEKLMKDHPNLNEAPSKLMYKKEEEPAKMSRKDNKEQIL